MSFNVQYALPAPPADQHHWHTDRYAEGSLADVRADGSLAILDRDRRLVRSYPPRSWTILLWHGARTAVPPSPVWIDQSHRRTDH